MKIAFWYWLIMAIWFFYGGFLGYRSRTNPSPFYWGIGWNFVLFILLVIIGCEIFPDPLGTLVHK